MPATQEAANRGATTSEAPRSGIHITRRSSDDASLVHQRGVISINDGTDVLSVQAPPTRTSFMAAWTPSRGAAGYRLDVSTSPAFDSYVPGWHDVDIGNATGRVVSGLNQGTIYFYRVRAYTASHTSASSEVTSATTTATRGLIIHPFFDGSITSNSMAGSIEATINRSIAIYENLFRDPITINILFRFASTGPDGRALAGVSQSNYVVYPIGWQTYIDALVADAKSKNDVSAIESLPVYGLPPHVGVASANGRAIGLNTPPAMLANGAVRVGGSYDGIVTIDSRTPFRFGRPPNTAYDAQRAIEHEIDEVIGFGSFINQGSDVRPQDLFSWDAWQQRSFSGERYFSIDDGKTQIAMFNTVESQDLGDWYNQDCPKTGPPYVQDAVTCPDQVADVTLTSPEGINLDVIGYDPANSDVADVDLSRPQAIVADFNADGSPDLLLYNRTTRRTAIWYLDQSLRLIAGQYGPTIPFGWSLMDAADFNGDGHPDYLLVNRSAGKTAIWYLSGPTLLAGVYGPSIPAGWKLLFARDFNNDGKPDWVLSNLTTHQTAVWYMNNNVLTAGVYGPTIPSGWTLLGAADFNHEGNQDYLLYKPNTDPTTAQTAIWYLSGMNLSAGRYVSSSGFSLAGAAGFPSQHDPSNNPDFLLFDPALLTTQVWYLDSNAQGEGSDAGPNLPYGWSLIVR